MSSVLPNKTSHIKDHFERGKKLGRGQYGTTYLCTERSTGLQFACKSISKRHLLSAEDFDHVRNEIEIMQHLSDRPNVVKIKDAYESELSVNIVMELCAGGELFDRIVKKGHYSERSAAQLMKTIVGVIEDCHSLGVMHRDLKPENLLFVDDSEDAVLKATDFGLSVFFKPGDEFTELVGSPNYVAPEVLMKHYGPEADIWSAGVILYTLLSGAPPFLDATNREIFRKILHGKLDLNSASWLEVSNSAKDLICNMLNRNPKGRFTASQVLCHPWIADENGAPDKPLDPVVLSRLNHFSNTKKLKKMALKFMGDKLSDEEKGDLKEWFKTIDTDKSETITFDELKKGLQRIGSELVNSEIQALMDAADMDGNGTIDYSEFIAATMDYNKVASEERLKSAFLHFANKSGDSITIHDLQKVCNEMGFHEARLDEIIKEIDQNNDKQIDYEEFAAMMTEGNGAVGVRKMGNGLAGLEDALKAAQLEN